MAGMKYVTKSGARGATTDGLGIAIAVLVSWGLSLGGVDMPVEVQAALGAVILGAAHRIDNYLQA